MPFDSRTRATLRSAEFGLFGVIVLTCVQTPRFCGAPFPRCKRPFKILKVKRSAGALIYLILGLRGFRTSWLTVGISPPTGCPAAGAGNRHIGIRNTKKRTDPIRRSI